MRKFPFQFFAHFSRFNFFELTSDRAFFETHFYYGRPLQIYGMTYEKSNKRCKTKYSMRASENGIENSRLFAHYYDVPDVTFRT